MSDKLKSQGSTMPAARSKSDQPLPMSPVWRGVNFVMGTFFLLAAAANANDGDWYLWVPLYLLPSLLCAAVSFQPRASGHPVWSSLVTLEFVICAVYLVYEIYSLSLVLSGTYENPLAHEEGRETGGLLIILAWAGMAKLLGSGRTSSSSSRVLMLSLVWVTTTLAVVPLFVWSLCFVSDWHQHLGHCNGMFVK